MKMRQQAKRIGESGRENRDEVKVGEREGAD